MLAGAAAVGAAAAQAVPLADTALAARLDAVARLRVGREVRIRLNNGGKLGGRFAGARGVGIGVRLPEPARLPPGAAVPDTAPYEVAVADVDSLWERRTLGPAMPFLGAGAGAVAGFLTVWADASTEEGECDSECSRASMAGGLIGAILGFAAGIVVGLVVPLWTIRFP